MDDGGTLSLGKSMKLQQLRYIRGVAQHDLNLSLTAEALFTSQPGLSKQIRLLEEELGVQIFERSGKQLVRITAAGEKILELAQRILTDVDNIRLTGREYSDPQHGTLSIATTHTQARYMLPPVIENFIRDYPEVRLNMHQGTPAQIAQLAASGEVDCCIATEAMELFEDLVMLPCYRWNRCILVPRDHPLCRETPLELEAIARYPIVTYVFGFTGRSRLDQAFAARGLTPNVVFTATDADVIKTYVRLGLGIGIIASMAYDPDIDADMRALDAGHLFESSITKFGLRRGLTLRGYMYDFIKLFAPHLSREKVDQAMAARRAEEVEQLFADEELPDY